MASAFASSLAALAAICASAAYAQDAATGDAIVVTGEREGANVVSGFVRDISEEASHEQLTRWDSPVCPLAIGMRPEFNAYVEQTVLSVAREVGAQAGQEDCDVNLVIAVAEEPGALVAALRADRPSLFEDILMPERRRLVESDDAVRAWSATHTRGADGRAVERIRLCVGSEASCNYVEQLTGVIPSRIERSTRRDLGVRFIVIDLDRVEGVTMQQLSGLVGMLALAQLDVDRPARPADRTILNLFHDPGAAPDDITDWDIAYLRGLYAIELARGESAQRGTITRIMRQELERGPVE